MTQTKNQSDFLRLFVNNQDCSATLLATIVRAADAARTGPRDPFSRLAIMEQRAAIWQQSTAEQPPACDDAHRLFHDPCPKWTARHNLTPKERAARRKAKEKKVATQLARKRALELAVRHAILHIAQSYHKTVASCYQSQYSSFVWGTEPVQSKSWPYKGKFSTYPRIFMQAAVSVPAGGKTIRICTSAGKIISLPRPPKALLQKAELDASHPVGLMACRLSGTDALACYGIVNGRWLVVGYIVGGVRVSESVALSPSSITLAAIKAEADVTVQQVMIKRYGIERYVTEVGPLVIDRDDCGVLYDLTAKSSYRGSMRVLQVRNSTPEPDGTYRDRFLPVPSGISTAQAALAWTVRQAA